MVRIVSCNRSLGSARRPPVNRVVASLALGLVFACVVSWMPNATSESGGAAYAQTQKKKAKAAPPPKTAPKGPPKRIPYAADDAAAAIVPGFPNVRAWGDTAEDFRKILPSSNGAWLAM